MRDFWHYLASILMWILFGYYWYVVSGRQISLAGFQALGVLSGIAGLGLIATLLWVRHNLNLAARNRRRERPAPGPEILDRDTLGRPVIGPDLAALKKAPVIGISLDGDDRKVYTAGWGKGS
ncbi:hypothetical protein KJ682_06445 [bacterium]|nr:hypothetical protein [bacterium]